MKSCKTCGSIKPLSQFPAQPRNKDGRSGSCRDCENKKRLAWVKANPERRAKTLAKYEEKNADKIKKSKEKHYQANKAKIIARAAEWKRENPDAVSKSSAKRYEENRDRILKMNRQWVRINAAKMRSYCQKRRARIKGVGGTFTMLDIEKLFSHQRGCCAICKLPLGKSFHIDHIVPIVRGGPNSPKNLQLLHQKCNQEKSYKDPISFMQSKGFLL